MKLDVQNPQIWFEAAVNPFAAPACNISGLKDAGTRSIFSCLITSTFSGMRCDENPFTCQCEKEDKKAEGFQISHLCGSFSNEILAAKGLSCESSKCS